MRIHNISKVLKSLCASDKTFSQIFHLRFEGREVTAVDNVAQRTGFFGGFMETRPLLPALMEKKVDDMRLGASGIVSFPCVFLVTESQKRKD